MADVSQIRLPNGDTFDLIDEKSGYITAQYIENKTDYSIPVSRVGEIVVGETAIGTDSTNFPTSKAVVDYVDERVVQEIEAINVGVTSIKANGTSLTVENGVVNIPIVGPNQAVGLVTDEYMTQIYEDISTIGNNIPTSTSQLTNDSGYLTSSDIASVLTYKGTKASSSALPSSGNLTGDVWHITDTGAEYAWDGSTWQELGTAIDLSNYATKATTLAGYGITDAKIENGTITLGSNTITPLTSFTETDPTVPSWAKQSSKPTYTAAEVGALPDSTSIPTKTSDLTNDSGFITSYTDEKLGLSLVSSSVIYYPILTQDTTTAQKKNYDNDGFKYYNYNGTTSAIGNAKLTLGNEKTATTAKNKQGTLELYGSTIYATRITAGAPTATRNIEFPNASGTIALTSDIPSVYSSTNTGGYLTMATLPIYDGTVE